MKKVALEQGMEVPFDKISKKVEQDYMTISTNIIQNSTPEELYEMIGAEKMKQIRNLDLQKVKKNWVSGSSIISVKSKREA